MNKIILYDAETSTHRIFEYMGSEYVHQEYEDCTVSHALFLFADENQQKYYVESPYFSSADPNYQILAIGTIRTTLAIIQGMDVHEAIAKYYSAYTDNDLDKIEFDVD